MTNSHPSTDLTPQGPPTLFGPVPPDEVAIMAAAAAKRVKQIIDTAGMVTVIGGREHVEIAGWQTAGGLFGIVAVTEWTRPLDDFDGWEARAVAYRGDQIVGAAEAMCTRDERNWRGRDEFAIRSMAQTRAQSKALAGPLRWIVALAGYGGTPAEEITSDGPQTPQTAIPAWADDVDEDAVHRMAENLEKVLAACGVLEPGPAAEAVGNRLANFCDATVPACTARLARILADAVDRAPRMADAEGDA